MKSLKFLVQIVELDTDGATQWHDGQEEIRMALEDAAARIARLATTGMLPRVFVTTEEENE